MEFKKSKINNMVYESLGDRWYTAQDDPVALLRAEANTRNRWVLEYLAKEKSSNYSILDIGCGAGFLSNTLVKTGYSVTGIDQSASSLEVARKYDSTSRAHYEMGDATRLHYPNESFDAVCAMDFLEHVEEPEKIITEASRVLKPGGLFFFHTFNRNPLSWLVVIKGVEWFVKNTPPNLHLYRLFIKPQELKKICAHHELEIETIIGLRPDVVSSLFWKMIFTRTVPKDLRFVFSRSLAVGYTGTARKSSQKVLEPPLKVKVHSS